MESAKQEKKGIKEICEALDAIPALVCPVKEALKDGKLNAEDAKIALSLLQNHKVILDGLAGLDQIVPEARDLDTAELAVLGAKVLDIVKKIQAS